MEEYKYNCSTFEYLQMESGLIPPPADSPDYIVIPVEKGDKAIAGDKIYEFKYKKWNEIGDVLSELENGREIL